MSTPLLPEVVSEIGANPVSFYSGGGGLGCHNYLAFREFAKHAEYSKFAASIGHQKLKGFSFRALCP